MINDRDRIEQLEVQLAGCGAAALGVVKPRSPEAKQGDFGWSASYADVVRLRHNFEAMRRHLRRVLEEPDNALARETAGELLDKIEAGL